MRDGEIAHATLLDFGIARDGSIGPSHALTRTGALIGTPAYMAPEQARGQAVVAAGADVFSLGCLFYECLTGRPPFIGEHLEAILVKILFEAEVPLRTLRPELPPSLETLMAQLLAKDPAARLPNAMALVETLQQLKTGSPISEGLRRPAPDKGVLTSSEQQLVSVFITRSEVAPANDSTLNPREFEAAQQRLVAVCELLTALGVRTEMLSDGTLVAALVPSRGEAATDQAQRAARAALLVRERCPDSFLALATGRGFLEGPVPIGEAVNLAVKLSHRHPLDDVRSADASASASISVVNPVIIDQATAGLLGQRFRVEPIDQEAVALFGEKPSFDETRRLIGKPTACVGRESELGQLEALLAACIEEASPRALLLLGPAGGGKSRLRHEFLRRVASRGDDILVLFGRSDPLAAGLPFSALRVAMLHLCDVQPSDSADAQRDKLQRRIAPVVSDAEKLRIVAFLGELCGVHFDDAQDPELREARKQPRRMEDCIRQAFLDWLSAEAAQQPIILVLEDLHWGDVATVALVDAALRELVERALFVLALGRPEVSESFPRLWHDRVQLMPLRPLSKKASEQLVRQVLGPKTPPETMARLVERAAGNALYLEELIRACAEDTAAELPKTVLAMLQARIGRLEAGARRALRAASVFGETLWSSGVAALLGMDRAECERWLVHLLREELLERRPESRFPGEIEYRFRHGLLRDAAYSMLSESDRRLGHRLAARFLVTCNEQPQTVAYHLHEAGELKEAALSYVVAGDEAIRFGILTEARRAYANAEQLLDRLPTREALRRVHIDTLCKQVQAGLTSDAVPLQLSRLDKARALCLRPGQDGDSRAVTAHAREDAALILRVDFLCGSVSHFGGRPYDAMRYFRKVQPIAEALGDLESAIIAAMMIGLGLCIEGRFELCRERLAWVLPLVEQVDRREWLRGYSYYVMALAGAGRGGEALASAERGSLVSGSELHHLTTATQRVMRGITHLLGGNWPAGLAEGQKLLEMAGKVGDKLFFYAAWDIMAWAESHLGETEQALAHRAQARNCRAAMGGGVLSDWLEAEEAELLLNAGRPQQAAEQARAVVAASRPVGLLFSQALGERVLAEALHRIGGRLDEVEAHFAAALTLCAEGAQVLNAAFTELAWARVLVQRGAKEKARTHLITAITTLEKSGCTYAVARARELL